MTKGVQFHFLVPVIGVLLSALVLVAFVDFLSNRPVRADAPWTERFPSPDGKPEPYPVPFNVTAQSCLSCHTNTYNEWAVSHHAWANRPLMKALDREAFQPPRRYVAGTVTTSVARLDGDLHLTTLGPGGTNQAFVPVSAFGYTPLVQYLIPFPGGRLQSTEMAYDPLKKDWFNVYGEENRQPYEWGSWANRGMTWNVQCAYCHMTNLKKGYDIESDAYRTTWDDIGVSCQQCHGPMEGHEEAARREGYVARSTRTPEQAMQMCATCHSRREELTGTFRLGDWFLNHYRLSLPDSPGLYYADGQVLEEDYVYGSFIMSRMGFKGVTCADCHNPHSGATLAPVTNNVLCMTCHTIPGLRGAKPIDPLAHSFHKPESTGNLCVECHMPNTVYMARDPRRDHGFITPDPLLTRELGIPNACNRCHTNENETVDWSIEWVDKWYGEKMERRARKRARVVARAHQGDPTVVDELLGLAADEEVGAWRAVLTSLLAPWIDRDDVRKWLAKSLNDKEPLVRSAAVRALGRVPGARDFIRPLLDDLVRLVRLDAALALQGDLDTTSAAYAEFRAYLDYTSDQPPGVLRQAQLALAEDRPEDAEQWARKATAWEPYAGYTHYTLGMVLNRIGKNDEAARALSEAARLTPESGEYAYALALLYGETGRIRDALTQLQRSVEVEPGFGRGWYNLGLAYAGLDRLGEAAKALLCAEELEPANPDYPYARATVHYRRGQWAQSRQAVERTLQLAPNHSAAQALLRELRRPPAASGPRT